MLIRNIRLNLKVYESAFQKYRVNCRYVWKRCYLFLEKKEVKSRAVRNLRENEVDRFETKSQMLQGKSENQSVVRSAYSTSEN